jgi:hypothetical protein
MITIVVEITRSRVLKPPEKENERTSLKNSQTLKKNSLKNDHV